MPADWWDSPSAVSCALSRGPQAARAARRLTRNTLRDWGLSSLAEDAETIVGEFAANAVTHAAAVAPGRKQSAENMGLRLLRRNGEVICAVLDPSDVAPVLRPPGGIEEAGRGLQMVDALSDVWGWSPVAGRGKAVWAILFCA
jgi:anti-sigma regulatory factor (Ser/Thr protein kinase)